MFCGLQNFPPDFLWAWGWVDNHWNFSFGWTVPFKILQYFSSHIWAGTLAFVKLTQKSANLANPIEYWWERIQVVIMQKYWIWYPWQLVVRETSAQPRSSTWSCCVIQQCPLLSWLSNKWLASESAGVLVHDSIRFHRPTFVLLVGSCRFNFSRAVDLALWLLYACEKMRTNTHTHTHSSWLLWQSPHPPGQCLDPSLTSRHAFPLSFCFFIFLLQLLCEDKIPTTGVIPRSSYFKLMLYRAR